MTKYDSPHKMSFCSNIESKSLNNTLMQHLITNLLFLEWQPAASPFQRTSKRPQQFLALSGKLGRKYYSLDRFKRNVKILLLTA